MLKQAVGLKEADSSKVALKKVALQLADSSGIVLMAFLVALEAVKALMQLRAKNSCD